MKNKEYRTFSIIINKKNNPNLHKYFLEHSKLANNLYNVVAFYYRQVSRGFKNVVNKEEKIVRAGWNKMGYTYEKGKRTFKHKDNVELTFKHKNNVIVCELSPDPEKECYSIINDENKDIAKSENWKELTEEMNRLNIEVPQRPPSYTQASAIIKVLESIEPINIKKKLKKIDGKIWEAPSEKNYRLHEYFMSEFLNYIGEENYIKLPSVVRGYIIGDFFNNMLSYYKALESYKSNQNNFTGKPKEPKYSKKGSLKTITFDRVSIKEKIKKIKENEIEHEIEHEIKFPNEKVFLNIGKSFEKRKDGTLKKIKVVQNSNGEFEKREDGTLKQVKVKQNLNGEFNVLLIFEIEETDQLKDNGRILSIDLGIDNLATITSNTGMKPIIINGKGIKAMNQLYNKNVAKYKSMLTKGAKPDEGKKTSKRLKLIHNKRNLRMKDTIHKVTANIVRIAVDERVSKVVIGKNDGWKQKVNIGTATQNFCQIPHAQLIDKLQYKLKEKGIEFIQQEESYTSKASFLSRDSIPTYGKTEEKPTFSGTRFRKVPKGHKARKGRKALYKDKEYHRIYGRIINADVNGSANIMRKAFEDAFENKFDEEGKAIDFNHIMTSKPKKININGIVGSNRKYRTLQLFLLYSHWLTNKLNLLSMKKVRTKEEQETKDLVTSGV